MGPTFRPAMTSIAGEVASGIPACQVRQNSTGESDNQKVYEQHHIISYYIISHNHHSHSSIRIIISHVCDSLSWGTPFLKPVFKSDTWQTFVKKCAGGLTYCNSHHHLHVLRGRSAASQLWFSWWPQNQEQLIIFNTTLQEPIVSTTNLLGVSRKKLSLPPRNLKRLCSTLKKLQDVLDEFEAELSELSSF